MGGLTGVIPSARPDQRKQSLAALALLLALGQAPAPASVVVPFDLSVTKTDMPDQVTVGAELTYDMTVSLNGFGGEGVSNVMLVDTLPMGVTFVSAAPSNCVFDPFGGEGQGQVTCNLGFLAFGSSADVRIIVKPNVPGLLSNRVTVNSDQCCDAEQSNDTAVENTTVVAGPVADPDLSVTKTDEPDPVLVNDDLTYTLTVMNGGEGGATGVSLTDTLPAGVTLVSFTSTQGDPCVGGVEQNQVTCDLGSLASGSSAMVTLVVQSNAMGMLTNHVVVSANETDPTPANNMATEQTTVNSAPPPPTTTTEPPTTTTLPPPALTCYGLPATIVGTNGPNNIIGTPRDDVIVGRGGNDRIDGQGGHDKICGNEGNDEIRGSDGNDMLSGDAGRDELEGGNGNDQLEGGTGNDELDGGNGQDSLFGREGNDALFGGNNNDFLDGGPNNDLLRGGSGFDTCINGPNVAQCEA